MSVIHRSGLNGQPQCGASDDAFGHRKISTTGVRVTCPACIGPSKDQARAEQLKVIRAAAQAYRAAALFKEGAQS